MSVLSSRHKESTCSMVETKKKEMNKSWNLISANDNNEDNSSFYKLGFVIDRFNDIFKKIGQLFS